jgi:hypothetical protein
MNNQESQLEPGSPEWYYEQAEALVLAAMSHGIQMVFIMRERDMLSNKGSDNIYCASNAGPIDMQGLVLWLSEKAKHDLWVSFNQRAMRREERD